MERGPGKVSVSFTIDGQDHHIWFAASGDEPGEENDFLLPLTLFPAMVGATPLRLPGQISPRLLSAAPKIQDVFGSWCTEHWRGVLENARNVPVDAEARAGRDKGGSGVGCFFSGGLDSFYTLLKHRDEITHLIIVYGFDITLDDKASRAQTDRVLRAQTSRMARQVATDLGKTLIEVETNLRSVTRSMVGWTEYHGAALASVALLFQHRFRKVLVPASYTYAEAPPRGSHPLLDPLWSTELTEIEHDGAEASRLEKTVHISQHELAMRWLRVCLVNPDGAYNCGRCEKCLRTMITLRVAGALERCETLPSEVDLSMVASTYIPSDVLSSRTLLRTLERLGTEQELTRALAQGIEASEMADREIEDQLRRRLSLQRRTLDETRARLQASRENAQRLQAKVRKLEVEGERLAKQNRLLATRQSGLRYRIADAVAGAAIRVFGALLLGRREKAEGPWDTDGSTS